MALSREEYAKPGELEKKARVWIQEIARNTGRKPPQVPEGQQALLLVDTQRFFLDPESKAYIPVAPALLETLKRVIQSAADQGLPIAATRHAHSSGSDSFPFTEIWRGLLMEDDPLAEAVAGLPPGNTAVFTKSTYSAFEGTALEDWLKERGVRVLILVGVTAHLCVETSARDAFCKGFFPIVLADAVASWTSAQHLRALLAVADGIGLVATADDIFGKEAAK